MWLLVLLFELLISISPIQATYLTGGVEHDEVVAPMPAELGVGKPYQAPKLPPAIALNWHQVPPWLPGGYYERKSSFRTIARYPYAQGSPPLRGHTVFKQAVVFGKLLDAAGNAWDENILPSISHATSDRGEFNEHILSKDYLALEPDRVVWHQKSYSIFTDWFTKRITKSTQFDVIKTIVKKNKRGDILITDDVQEYDFAGHPLQHYVAVGTEHRIADFKPVSYDHGIDLRASLTQHLLTIGQADLAPVQ